ncbi:hypothetical protein Glove_11g11 [Diversispora epigaea]|uniref:Uncharacterized protein n=1 Tax=Diversispora epigaea TaxID=1348612 RepID=A0A397JN38_9GLOM|nr:hypothetical protein Glove_11g11 [Diversispora epigaea]
MDPWNFNSLTETNINQLFNLTTNMKNILEKELINYIDEIIDELIIEKQKEENEIDKLVLSQSGSMGKMKKYKNVEIPTLYIPDRIPINPNSISNIKKVLEHIYEITGIKSGLRKWVAVVCDGVPYNLIQKIKKEFPWLILIPGALHKEMNMLKAFVELNWIIDIKEFAQIQELIWPFVQNCKDPTAHKYLEWSKKQTNFVYKLKFEQIFVYLQAIINFRNGIQNNNPLLQNAARRQFSPIWSARRHHIYRLIEITYEEQMQRLKPQIRNIIEKYHVISCSGYKNQHQGLDAILEEINKTLKSLVPPVPSQHYWEIAARNCMNFMKLRETLFKNIEYIDKESSRIRTKPDFAIESQSEELKNFTSLAQEKRKTFIKQKLLQLTTNEIWETIPISAEEALSQKNENNMTKEQLIVVINSLLVSFPESQNVRYNNLNNKPKTTLLNILQEVWGLQNIIE